MNPLTKLYRHFFPPARQPQIGEYWYCYHACIDTEMVRVCGIYNGLVLYNYANLDFTLETTPPCLAGKDIKTFLRQYTFCK